VAERKNGKGKKGKKNTGGIYVILKNSKWGRQKKRAFTPD
jgi:hypothetical protein